MLLNFLKQFYHPEITPSPVNLAKLSNFMEGQWMKQLDIQSRYMKTSGVESHGVRLLEHILSVVDIDYLNSLSNDFDRFNYYFKFMEDNLVSIFDANSAKRTYTDMFILKGLFQTVEFLLPVSRANYIGTLPLGEEWFQWKSVLPVKLMDHDSLELSLDMTQGKLKFKGLQPTYAVIGIDPVSLCFKYFKYIQEYGVHASKVEFIHKHVLYGFFNDIQNIWLRNQCLAMLNITDATGIEKPIMFDKTYGYIGSQYYDAMKNIMMLIDRVRSGKIKPYVFFHSIMMQSDTGGMMNMADHLDKTLNESLIPPLRQYLWQAYMRDRSWIELIVRIFLENPRTTITQNMRKKLRAKMIMTANSKFWNNINDDSTKMLMMKHLRYIRSMLD